MCLPGIYFLLSGGASVLHLISGTRTEVLWVYPVCPDPREELSTQILGRRVLAEGGTASLVQGGAAGDLSRRALTRLGRVPAGGGAVEERGHREEEHVPPGCHRVAALRGHVLARRGQGARAARGEQRAPVSAGAAAPSTAAPRRRRPETAQKPIPVFDFIPFLEGRPGWDGAGGLGEPERWRRFPIHPLLWSWAGGCSEAMSGAAPSPVCPEPRPGSREGQSTWRPSLCFSPRGEAAFGAL